jgi:hypothetical protein
MTRYLLLAAALAALASPARAADKPPGGHTGTQQSSRLYTAPDPSATGGIHLRAPGDRAPVAAFALQAFETKYVYAGEVRGADITFTGLPPAKYDLLLLFEDGFCEGLRLSRDESSLTEPDRKSIETIINRSVPFFDTKVIHRCEGATGRAGAAACVLQELRTKPVTLQDASVRTDIQIRSLKLVGLEDVGATGWQLLVTREIVRTEVAGSERRGVLKHQYVPALGAIRVTDQVKDLGEVKLESR